MPEKKRGNDSSTPIVVLLIVLLLMLILTDFTAYFLYTYKPGQASAASSAEKEVVTVSSITSGDTFVTSDGRVVKMIGIEAPSAGQPFFAESSNFLKFLAQGKAVQLEPDKQDTDSSGNLLRYVYVEYNGQLLFLNYDSVAQGYSILKPEPPNTKYESRLAQARQDCVASKLNLCGDSLS